MKTETKTIRTVIPAQPGFDVVVLRLTPYQFEYVPIVAWAIDDHAEADDASANPICIDNNENGGGSLAVRQPNGEIRFHGTWRTFQKGQETEALAYAVEQHQRRLGVRAAWNGTAEAAR